MKFIENKNNKGLYFDPVKKAIVNGPKLLNKMDTYETKKLLTQNNRRNKRAVY